MNFFASVFSDAPDPKLDSESDNAHRSQPRDASSGDSSPAEHRSGPSDTGPWDFGGLLKTLSMKSESIIETYRRDLQEFGTGLKKEIEVAQGSLESVGQAIDHFGNTVAKGTAQIISHSKDAILDSDSDSHKNEKEFGSSKRYSRFDSQVRAIQGDVSTYSEVPEEDLDDYNMWKSEFSLEGRSYEMEEFLIENEAMEIVYKRLVPNTVDAETFWFRYYYKVYKFKKAEDVRARLVKRMSKEEEVLSWDVDDDEEEEDDDDVDEDEHLGHGKLGLEIKKEAGDVNQGKRGDSELQNGKPGLEINKEGGDENQGKKADSELLGGGLDANSVVGTEGTNVEEVHKSGGEDSKVEKRDGLLQSKELDNKMDESVEESKVDKNSGVVHEMMGDGSKKISNEVDSMNDSAADSNQKVMMERKDEDGKSAPVASQHSAHEEDDLEWDEIEDLSGIDEKKASDWTGSPSKVDLRKRLSAAQEDEDLSWDIEVDDEPAKA